MAVLGKEPTVIIGAIGELIRQIIPMLVIFGLVNWTDAQIGVVFMVVSALLALVTVLFTRSQVSSEDSVNELLRTANDLPADTPIGVIKTVQAEKDEAK